MEITRDPYVYERFDLLLSSLGLDNLFSFEPFL